jgi:hypothetical protein
MPRKLNIRGLLASDIGANPHVLPDEDPKAFIEMRDSLLEELNPETPFELRLALDLVHVEWEAGRHRRLMSATVRTAFFEEAEGAYENGKIGRRLTFGITPDQTKFMQRLKSSDINERREAEKILRDRGVTTAEITAAAVTARESPVNYHETRVAQLEQRRRALMRDYKLLKEAKKAKGNDVDKAESKSKAAS